MEVKSNSMAWRTVVSIGRMLSRVDREAAHVSTEHQFLQALTRVARALPREVMMLVKARLMSPTVWEVATAMEEMTGSQLPSAPSRGAPSEP